MKIFNWVHRKLNNKENEKKNGDIAADDYQFQAENKCNVFERWRGGILAIGTFGYDPLKDESEQNTDAANYLCEKDEELEMEQVASAEYQSNDDTTDSEEEEEEEEEENPLVFAAYAQDVEGSLMEMNMEENRREDFGFEYVMMEKMARTTLADLFYADSEDMKKQPLKKGETTKERSRCKHGFSFGKKLILDEARPIHKLHQLMRRMLKRKIHPDIAPVSSTKVSGAKECDVNDHTSLLPTQDAII